METVLCRLRTDDFPVNFIEGYQRDPGSGQTAVLGIVLPKSNCRGWMIGRLIWYDRDRDIGNDLQNEWRLWIMNLEFWILDGIQNLRTPAADVLMPFITSFGNGGVIWIVLTVILLLIPKTRKTGLILGAALILDGIFCNLLLKNLVRRIRPCDINDAIRLLIPYPSDYSFPSGHTAVSFAAASALYFAGEKYLWKAALVLAAFIAFSRMYLYVHYPTDILGGALLGILCGYLGCRIVQKTEQYKRKI